MANAIKKVAEKSEAFLKEFQTDVKRKDMELKAFCRKKEQELSVVDLWFWYRKSIYPDLTEPVLKTRRSSAR